MKPYLIKSCKTLTERTHSRPSAIMSPAKSWNIYKKELQKTNQKEFSVEKAIKRKGDNLYVKWNGYGSSFNSWIDKKDIV